MSLSRISQAKIVGFSLLYDSILLTTIGVATFGLDPPMTELWFGARNKPDNMDAVWWGWWWFERWGCPEWSCWGEWCCPGDEDPDPVEAEWGWRGEWGGRSCPVAPGIILREKRWDIKFAAGFEAAAAAAAENNGFPGDDDPVDEFIPDSKKRLTVKTKNSYLMCSF